MSGKGYRILLECRRRSEILRGKGFTYDQIADVFAMDHEVSPLRLYRYAHGQTARDTAMTFNELDPAGTASLREVRLYDYESGVRRPSAQTIALFGHVYMTSASRLLAPGTYQALSMRDREIIAAADFRHLDPHQCRPGPSHVTVEETGADAEPSSGLTARGCAELLRTVDAMEADVRRRDLLFELAAALGGVPALNLLDRLTPDDGQRLATVVRGDGRVDAQAVRTVEELTAQCRRLDDRLGAKKALPVADRQRELVAGLLRREPLLPGLRDRLAHVYAELSQLSGYLRYDLMDYDGAERCLGEGLAAALEIGDSQLIAYIHSWRGAVAVFRGRAAEATDHIYAADGWIGRRRGRLAAMNVSVQAGVEAMNGSVDGCRRSMDRATALAATQGPEEPPYVYWISPSMLESKAALYFVQLKRAKDAISAAQHSLRTLGPAFRLDRAFALVQYGCALAAAREVKESAAKLSEAAQIAPQQGSARLHDLLRRGRRKLEPWSDNSHVRDLDERLRTHGIV